MTPPDRHHEHALVRYRKAALELVWQSPWVRAVCYALLMVGVLALLISLWPRYAFAFQVAVVGFVIAYILNPLVAFFGRLRIGRGLGVILVYVLLALLFVLGSIIFTQVAGEVARFARTVPEVIENITPLIERVSLWLIGWQESLPEFLAERFTVPPAVESEEAITQVERQIETLLSWAAGGFNTAVDYVRDEGPGLLLTAGTTVFSTTFQVFLMFIASAYFLYDFPKFTRNFFRFVPVRYRDVYQDVIDKADRAVGGYLRGQILLAAILGIFVYIGLTLIGVRFALAISFVAAIFDLVPFLGPVVATIPAVLMGFAESPLTALLALVVMFTANQIEAHLLGPVILARSTNVHPVTVLISILVGGGLFGLVGALLAVPFVSLAKVLLEEYLLKRPAFGYGQVPEIVNATAADQTAGSSSDEAEPPAPPSKPTTSRPPKVGSKRLDIGD